jgi:polar amino acid transport system substrate-binding protein
MRLNFLARAEIRKEAAMRTIRRVSTAILGLLLTACAGMHTAPAPEVRQALAPTGKLRVGVYPGSPFSMIRDSVSGETKGVTVEIGRALAMRLGVPYEAVEYQRIAEVLEAMKSGKVDITIANATPARAQVLDWTPPLLLIELGYLVLSGSPVASLADVDRPGIRVGVTQGGTSNSTLARELKNAKIVPAPTLKSAIEMLSQRSIDAYATNKANLFEMSDRLPGSRVLDGQWGLERLSIAIPKGRDQGMAYVRKFVEDIKTEGLVARAAERAGLRGTVNAE